MYVHQPNYIVIFKTILILYVIRIWQRRYVSIDYVIRCDCTIIKINACSNWFSFYPLCAAYFNILNSLQSWQNVSCALQKSNKNIPIEHAMTDFSASKTTFWNSKNSTEHNYAIQLLKMILRSAKMNMLISKKKIFETETCTLSDLKSPFLRGGINPAFSHFVVQAQTLFSSFSRSGQKSLFPI